MSSGETQKHLELESRVKSKTQIKHKTKLSLTCISEDGWLHKQLLAELKTMSSNEHLVSWIQSYVSQSTVVIEFVDCFANFPKRIQLFVTG